MAVMVEDYVQWVYKTQSVSLLYKAIILYKAIKHPESAQNTICASCFPGSAQINCLEGADAAKF